MGPERDWNGPHRALEVDGGSPGFHLREQEGF